MPSYRFQNATPDSAAMVCWLSTIALMPGMVQSVPLSSLPSWSPTLHIRMPASGKVFLMKSMTCFMLRTYWVYFLAFLVTTFTPYCSTMRS